ncbi:MAG TPA: response regulator [Methylomirabilota bacterium]|jgi:CheY-like chemotaxis protein|nr:response regulator [Methylomirabilota bacterium]
MTREHGLEATRLLLVEDAEDIRAVFTMLLEAEGARVVATGSGAEAAALAAREDFDVLLTDLGLPDIPGDVLIRRVLAGARRRPRVVVVTGYDEPFLSRARQAGADVVLTKPVAWTELLAHLQPTRDRRLAA